MEAVQPRPLGGKEKLVNIMWALSRYAVALLFIYSSMYKIRQPYNFIYNVYDYDIFGVFVGFAIAVVIPWLEFLIGLFLITGIYYEGAILISIFMSVMFIVLQLSAILRNMQISCGCFGANSSAIGAGSLINTIIILNIALLSYLCSLYLTRNHNPVPATV